MHYIISYHISHQNACCLQMVFKEIKWPWHAKNDAPFLMNLGPVHCSHNPWFMDVQMTNPSAPNFTLPLFLGLVSEKNVGMLEPIMENGHQLLAILRETVRPLKMCGYPMGIFSSDVLLNASH